MAATKNSTVTKKSIWARMYQGYIYDSVSYDPHLEDYELILLDEVPPMINNHCFKYEDGVLTLDKVKLEEQERKDKGVIIDTQTQEDIADTNLNGLDTMESVLQIWETLEGVKRQNQLIMAKLGVVEK